MKVSLDWWKVRWVDEAGRTRESVCYYDEPSALDRVAGMLLDDMEAEAVRVPPPHGGRAA